MERETASINAESNSHLAILPARLPGRAQTAAGGGRSGAAINLRWYGNRGQCKAMSNLLWRMKTQLSRELCCLVPAQVLLVDMQYGAGDDPDADSHLAEYFLEEINASHQHSRGCFLLVRNVHNVTYRLRHYTYLSLLRKVKNDTTVRHSVLSPENFSEISKKRFFFRIFFLLR